MKNPILRVALPVMSLCLIFLSTAVRAYDCSSVPAFVYGQGTAGQVYQNVDKAFECQQDWCAWSRPGEDSWAEYSWEELGDCESEPEPVSSPPRVIVSYLYDSNEIYVNNTYSFAGAASDTDGDLVSWALVVYESNDGELESPEIIDSGTSTGTGRAQLAGEWPAENKGVYVLVVEATDSQGNSSARQWDFTVTDTPASVDISHPDFIVLGEQITVTVETYHPSNSSLPTIEIRDPEGSNISTSTSSSSSSGGPSASWTLNVLATPEIPGKYVVAVAWPNEPDLDKYTNFVVTDPDSDPPTFSISPNTWYQSYIGDFSYSSWHPAVVNAPQLVLTRPDGSSSDLNWYGSTSASGSGGNGVGYDHFRHSSEFSFGPTMGEYVIAANYANGDTLEATLEVVSGYLSEPRITISNNSDFVDGETTEIATYISKIYQPETVEVLVDGESLGFDGTIPINSNYRIEATHSWLAEAGAHTITARAFNDRGDVFEKTREIEVEESGTTGTGDCDAEGVNPDTVNEYPNWTSRDWSGGPYNHASAGDLMIFESAVYSAQWHTTTEPGSDSSWEYVCALE